MTTIEEMQRLLPDLEVAVEATQDSDLRSDLSALQGLSRSYHDFKAAGAKGVSLPVFRMGGNSGAVKRLREQIALLIIPSLLGVEATDQPKSDETVAEYLRRLLQSACEKRNWDQAELILDLPQKIQLDALPHASADRIAISQFSSGLTLEEAKQYALAVNAYQLALKTGSDLIPAKEIGERLEAIKNSHPEEYKLGTERTLTPPRPPSAPRSSLGGSFRR